MRFIGGPVDGGIIKLEPQYSKYLIPVRPTPHILTPEPEDAVPESKLLCYVYERRGHFLIYTGEHMK